MKENSDTFKLLEHVWRANKLNSCSSLNSIMQDALMLAINAKMNIHEDDFGKFLKSFRAGYWFGVNQNGKGYGEIFYNCAARTFNTPACISYEKSTGLKPFIIDNKRAYTGMKFLDNEYKRRLRVTGFDFKGKIYLVAYDLNDWEEKGKKNLMNFTNKQWLEYRKMIYIN